MFLAHTDNYVKLHKINCEDLYTAAVAGSPTTAHTLDVTHGYHGNTIATGNLIIALRLLYCIIIVF